MTSRYKFQNYLNQIKSFDLIGQLKICYSENFDYLSKILSS